MNTATLTLALPDLSRSGSPFAGPPEVIKKYDAVNDLPTISESKDVSIRNDRTKIVLREQSRVQRLRLFLKELVRSEAVENYTATIAWRMWRELSQELANKLPVPDVAAGAENQILFSWDNGTDHFELEIFPPGLGEFFYLNYETDETWEEEHHSERVSQSVVDFLSLFLLYE